MVSPFQGLDTIPAYVALLPLSTQGNRHFLNNVYNSLETKRLVHGQSTQNLPIQNDPTPTLHLNKLRIRNPVLPDPGIHPLYPQFAKLPFFYLAVTIGVLP